MLNYAVSSKHNFRTTYYDDIFEKYCIPPNTLTMRDATGRDYGPRLPAATSHKIDVLRLCDFSFSENPPPPPQCMNMDLRSVFWNKRALQNHRYYSIMVIVYLAHIKKGIVKIIIIIIPF